LSSDNINDDDMKRKDGEENRKFAAKKVVLAY